VPDTASSKSAPEWGGDDIPTPSDDRSRADQGTTSSGTQSTNREEIKHNIKFLQINLHHSKAATATLCQQLAVRKADVALIQEPWLHKSHIRGLTNTGGTVYSVAPDNNARSCIYTRNYINALPLWSSVLGTQQR
jgi:hypothetical protein